MTYQKALIVDDSKLARISLKKKLEQRGLETVMAEDARQALDMLKTTPVDVVFMDHLMPEMDGFQATQAIRGNAATAHLPVIMCSGKENEGYLQEAQAIGATNILSKPPEDEALSAVLAELEKSGLRVDTSTAQAVAAAANEPHAAESAVAPYDDLLASAIRPLSERVSALTAQLNALSGDIEERLTASGRVMAMIEANQSSTQFDPGEFRQELQASLEQRLAEQSPPNLEALREELASAQTTAIERAVERSGAAWRAAVDGWAQGAPASLKQCIESTCAARLEPALLDQRNRWEAELGQAQSSWRAAREADRAEAPDVTALKRELLGNLKAEMNHLAPPSADSRQVETAVQEALETALKGQSAAIERLSGRIRAWQWLTLGSCLIAAGAVALHWLL